MARVLVADRSGGNVSVHNERIGCEVPLARSAEDLRLAIPELQVPQVAASPQPLPCAALGPIVQGGPSTAEREVEILSRILIIDPELYKAE
jgi:hypothetical protein